MDWLIKTFEELSTKELYQLLQLRQEVFIIEQNCPYPDADDKDFNSIHILGMEGDDLFAYARLVFPGLKFEEPSIGRVVVSPKARNTGLGYELMRRAIMVTKKLFPNQHNRIGAQAHLQKFYENCGFERVSDIYDEDGIPHIEMLLK